MVTLDDILNALPEEARKHATENGLKKTVVELGKREGDRTFISTKLGNLVVHDEPRTHLGKEGHDEVHLYGAGPKTIFIDNLTVR